MRVKAADFNGKRYSIVTSAQINPSLVCYECGVLIGNDEVLVEAHDRFHVGVEDTSARAGRSTQRIN